MPFLIVPNEFRIGEVFEVYPDDSADQLYSISTGYRKVKEGEEFN